MEEAGLERENERVFSMGDWFKNAVVYQVYPKSFQDTDGDGLGDLRGVTQHLDYIRDLGADVIWLNPVYKNSGVDGGYDISDYREIAPELGTMADFDELRAGACARPAHRDGSGGEPHLHGAQVVSGIARKPG